MCVCVCVCVCVHLLVHCYDLSVTPSSLPPVYSLSLVHIIQVICEPITQLLATELERNKEMLHGLTQERDRLISLLKERNIVPEFETEF